MDRETPSEARPAEGGTEPPMRPPDILYLGYAKAASTFLRGFFADHPDVFVDRIAARHLLSPERVAFSAEERARAARAKVYVSMQERLSESVLYERPQAWPPLKWRTSGWEDLVGVIDVDPGEVARRWKARFPLSRALLVIRDQVDWLGSVYRYYVDNLTPGRRSFADFCRTPKGMVLLRAGLYDLTIEAYLGCFGEAGVKVLRFETLAADREAFVEALCGFLGVEAIPYAASPANVGRSAAAAAVLRHFPAAGALPAGLKRMGMGALSSLGGRKGDVFSERERRFIESFYAVSNLRTEKLVQRIEGR